MLVELLAFSMALLLFGLMLGVRHALEADHLAAVAALAGEQTHPAAVVRQAAAWSLGHAAVLLLFGGALLAADLPVSPELAAGLEALVGVVLVVLGTRILLRLMSAGPGLATVSVGSSSTAALTRTPSTGTALGVGMLHGLAGSAALLLLALNESESMLSGLGLIACFSVGSILGMVAVSLLLALPLRELQRHATVFSAVLLVLGMVTLLLGLSLTWESLATLA